MQANFSNKLLSLAFIMILIIATVFTVLRIPMVSSQETLLHSHKVSGDLPVTDPESGIWWHTIPLQVPLSTQTTTPPKLLESSIRAVTVRSLNNGTWIMFLLEWNDATINNSTTRTEDFRDSAAIQIPPSQAPPYVCMGQQDVAVNIWHWKADWQADINTVFHDIEQTYPNFWVDYYPHAIGGPPYTVPTSFPPEIRNLTSTGWAVGNPLSNPLKLSPVEDLIAGGFGTLTTQSQQNVMGRGVWKDGKWHVVFARPLQTDDSTDAQLRPGEQPSVAFAIWDGANKEVDGRKSISAWLTLGIDETGPPLIPFHLVDPVRAAAVLVLILVIAIVAFSIMSKPKEEKAE